MNPLISVKKNVWKTGMEWVDDNRSNNTDRELHSTSSDHFVAEKLVKKLSAEDSEIPVITDVFVSQNLTNVDSLSDHEEILLTMTNQRKKKVSHPRSKILTSKDHIDSKTMSRTCHALDLLKKNFRVEKDFKKLNACMESLHALQKILKNEQHKQHIFIKGKLDFSKESTSVVQMKKRPLTPAQKLLKKFSLVNTAQMLQDDFVDKNWCLPKCRTEKIDVGVVRAEEINPVKTGKRKRQTEMDQLIDTSLNESWMKGKSASHVSEALSFREERALNYAIAQFAEMEKNGMTKQKESSTEGKQVITSQMKKNHNVKRKIAGKIKRKNLSRKFFMKNRQLFSQAVVKKKISGNKKSMNDEQFSLVVERTDYPLKNCDIVKTTKKMSTALNAKKQNRSRCTGETLLHKAVRLGDYKLAEESIENGANIHASDYTGWTSLHEACSRGKIDVIRVLLKYGADPSMVSHSGLSPLHSAVCKGDFSSIRLLLSFGADLEISSYTGVLPADLATKSNVKSFLQDVLNEKDILKHPGLKNQLNWTFASSCDMLDTNDCAGIFNELPTDEPATFSFTMCREEFPISYYLPYNDSTGEFVGYRNYFILSEILQKFGISKNALLNGSSGCTMTLTRWQLEQYSQQNISTVDLFHVKRPTDRIQLVHIPPHALQAYMRAQLYEV